MVSHKKKPAQKGRFLLILECTDVVQEGNIRKTMAARGLVNGRGPRSGRDLVFRCYPPELLSPQKQQKLTFGSASVVGFYSVTYAMNAATKARMA